ncbi:GTP 3',8-cyclase MoaA [Candidatus Woesearchaeota archaeon]|nr:GTP 3',8-cyclase MoaA [Candidatus Woesearchaeota archaeon]
MINATMTDATITDATITDATITDATITDATMTDATMTDATITDATITDATMTDATMTDAKMIDAVGRHVDHLRLSLTKRCNLDCFYCHKEGNTQDTTGDAGNMHEVSTEKVFEILSESKKAGISSLKLTGGEPLLRKDIAEIVRYADMLGYEDIGLTTNGTLLHSCACELADAGLNHVNIGCDTLTLSSQLPKNAVRLEKGMLESVRAGLQVKLNMVVLRGINDGEIWPMIDFCAAKGINLQLIELVRLGDMGIFESYFYPLMDIEDELRQRSESVRKRAMQGRMRYYMDGIFVEVVRPSPDFCSRCNKVRIDCHGRIMPCLMRKDEVFEFKGACALAKAVKARDKYGYG